MRWIFDYARAAAVSRALGTMEIIAALMIAAYPWYPRVTAAGSAMAVVLFTGTLSFLFATPGFSVTRGVDPPPRVTSAGRWAPLGSLPWHRRPYV